MFQIGWIHISTQMPDIQCNILYLNQFLVDTNGVKLKTYWEIPLLCFMLSIIMLTIREIDSSVRKMMMGDLE